MEEQVYRHLWFAINESTESLRNVLEENKHIVDYIHDLSYVARKYIDDNGIWNSPYCIAYTNPFTSYIVTDSFVIDVSDFGFDTDSFICKKDSARSKLIAASDLMEIIEKLDFDQKSEMKYLLNNVVSRLVNSQVSDSKAIEELVSELRENNIELNADTTEGLAQLFHDIIPKTYPEFALIGI